MRAVRLDDLGASSKAYEWWSRHRWANVWPLHHRKLFGAWGPYRELRAWELEDIFQMINRAGAQLTVAITAYWVERDGTLTPYSVKFPHQAALIRWWALHGRLEVAAHGLTHCVPGQHRPRWIGGNRPWHREYNRVAMRHLAADLGVPVTRYIRPGMLAGTTPEYVFHDREFVLDYRGSLRRLEAVMRA